MKTPRKFLEALSGCQDCLYCFMFPDGWHTQEPLRRQSLARSCQIGVCGRCRPDLSRSSAGQHESSDLEKRLMRSANYHDRYAGRKPSWHFQQPLPRSTHTPQRARHPIAFLENNGLRVAATPRGGFP